MYRYQLYIILFFLSFSNLKSLAQYDTLSQYSTELAVLDFHDLILSKDSSEIEIITASRSSKNISDLPVTIYVIHHDEIIANHYTTLTDILKTVPGIRVSQPGSGETGDYFEIRGLTGNFYTKILINGIPVKPSVVKGMPLGAQLPVRQAERIEIIFGPAAAIYGADAVSGVINIITKEAHQGTFIRADVSLGQNDYSYFNFTVGGKAGKNNNILKYNFFGSKTEFNDLNIKYDINRFYNPLNYFLDSITIAGINYNPAEVNINTPGIEDFMEENYGIQYEGTALEPKMEELPSSSYMVGADLNFRGIRLTFNNMYRQSHSSIGHNTFQYKYNNPQNYWGDLIRVYSLSYNKDWRRFSTFTQISNLIYRMDNNSSMGLTFTETTDKVYRYSAGNDFLFEQLFTFIPTTEIEIVTGLSYQKSGYLPITNYLSSPFDADEYTPFTKSISYRDSTFGSYGFNPGVFTNVSCFSQFFLKKNKFRVMGGIRTDFNSNYNAKLSPRIALLYKYSDRSTARLSAGYAFKAPPPSLEYETLVYPVSTPQQGYNYVMLPYEKLEPEKFQSVELGVITKMFWDITMNISLFYNEIYNQFFIYEIPVSEFPNISNAVNQTVLTKRNENSFSRAYGLQANISKSNIITSIRMKAELNLMFSRISQDLPNLESVLENFKLMPKHFGQLKLSFYPAKNIYLHFQNTWESKWLRNVIFLDKLYSDLFNKVDGYFTLDVTASYYVSNNLNAFVKVTNFFDEKYSGLNVTGRKEDKLYNPQLGRNIRFGLSYTLN